MGEISSFSNEVTRTDIGAMVDRSTETSQTGGLVLNSGKKKQRYQVWVSRGKDSSPSRSGSARSQASNRSDLGPYRDTCQGRALYK